MVNKERSPFTPGKPVPVDYFTGRISDIRKIEEALKRATAGHNENIFLTGERGIGKSSLADFVQFIAQRQLNFLACHCYLGPVRTVDEACRVVFLRLLEQMAESGMIEKARQALSKYVKGVEAGLFGVRFNIEFTSSTEELRDLRLNFMLNLRRMWGPFAREKAGILLIIDDLNGVTKIPDFAHFLKSTVDEMASDARGNPLPLVIMLVGIQERMDDLYSSQPSLPRIFDVVELAPLTGEESLEFYEKAFSSVNVKLEKGAAANLVRYAGGLPMLLHEIGDATFWWDDDNIVDEQDAQYGVFEAAERVGRKYLDHQVYQAIRSRSYRSILGKAASMPESTFTRAAIREVMSESDAKNFDNFRTRMESLGVMKKGEQRGTYEFTNSLFWLYFRMEAFRAEQESKRQKRS